MWLPVWCVSPPLDSKCQQGRDPLGRAHSQIPSVENCMKPNKHTMANEWTACGLYELLLIVGPRGRHLKEMRSGQGEEMVLSQSPGVWAQPRSEDSLTVWSPCQKGAQEHVPAVHRARLHQPWKCPALSAGECGLPAASPGSASRLHRPAGAGGDAGTCTSSSSSSSSGSPWTTHFIKLGWIPLFPRGMRTRHVPAYRERKWLCPHRMPLWKVLLSISVTDKKGNEGTKELSGYFLSEISLATDLVKKILGESQMQLHSIMTFSI